MAAIWGKRDAEMKEFWASLSPKVRAHLWREERRLVLSSEEVPLSLASGGRLRASTQKFYLFTDVFAVAQGTTVTEHLLEAIWVEHTTSTEHSCSFRLVFPEGSLDLLCKDLSHKSRWVGSVADVIGAALSLSQFVVGRGDLNLDTKLELLRSRDYLEYSYSSGHADYRDGRYKGQWRNAKPHGRGEFTQETTGRLYKGHFRDGRFHGQGEMHWFAGLDARKKYIGEFRNGEMEGYGELKYSNGDVYSGHWLRGQRCGFGRLEEASRKDSYYTGAWEAGKRSGYGVYEDKMKHQRYLGNWVEGVKSGPGMLVTSAGTYCEATFANGSIAAGSEGFVIDPNGRCFMGKLGHDLKLSGKGVLTLTNGSTIEGSFSGHWQKKIEISRAVLEDGERKEEGEDAAHSQRMAELQIANLDRRIGNCTVAACNKWQLVFAECEAALGFSGDAANDVFSAWSKLATDSFHRKKGSPQTSPPRTRRSNSLTHLHAKTVKLPVDLIPLERARALTSASPLRDDFLREDLLSSSHPSTDPISRSSRFNKSLSVASGLPFRSPSPIITFAEDRLEISRPMNLEESLGLSFHPGRPYRVSNSLHGVRDDSSSPEQEKASFSDPEDSIGMRDCEDGESESPNIKTAIQKYVDNAFSTTSHPLGILMTRLEVVFHESYGGIGANRFLLTHAIAETHSLIKRIHSIVRILFPFLSGDDQQVSRYGLMKVEGASDPDDYVSIESGYEIIHPLVFMRLFPTLITLYVLHHGNRDSVYQRGLDYLHDMDDDKLVCYMKFPSHVCRKITGAESEGDILRSIDGAANSLKRINSLFTPGEFLKQFRRAFHELNEIEQLSGDFLLPAVVFILVRANVPHLGAYLHFLTDFAFTRPADEYTLVTYEAAYNFIRRNVPGYK